MRSLRFQLAPKKRILIQFNLRRLLLDLPTSALLILALGGCAGVSVSRFVSESGEQRFQIECSGSLSSWTSCQEKADELCLSRGYSVVSSSLEKPDLAGEAPNTRILRLKCN